MQVPQNFCKHLIVRVYLDGGIKVIFNHNFRSKFPKIGCFVCIIIHF